MLRRIMDDQRSLGAVSDSVEILGYIDDRTVLTYAGDCFVVLGCPGVDCEALEDGEVDNVAQRSERARRVLGPEYRLYEYLFRRRSGEYYETDLFAVILRKAKRPKASAFSLFRSAKCMLMEDLKRSYHAVRHVAEDFVRQVDVCGYKVLGRTQSFPMLRRLLNFSPELLDGLPPICDQFIGYQLGDSWIQSVKERRRTETGDIVDPHIRVDHWFVRVMTLSELGPESRPLMLEKLQSIKGDFHLCAEWNVIEEGKGVVDKAKDVINNFKGSSSLMSSVGGKKGEKSESEKNAQQDEGDVMDVSELGQAQRRLRKGERLGDYSLTAVVYAETIAGLEETQHRIESVMREADCKMRAETQNQLGAFFATIPGGYGYQARKLPIFDSNASDLGFWHASAAGDPINVHLSAPSLLTLPTEQGTRYDLNLHLPAVNKAHTLVLGDSGTGKSFTIAAIMNAMQEKYSPYTVVFDKGNSFRWITLAHGGAHFKMSPTAIDDKCRMNPFGLPGTERNKKLMKLLARVLMEQNDRPLTAEELDRLHLCVEDLCMLDARRLSVLRVLLGSLGSRLTRWCEGGEYGWVFDHAEDTLSLGKIMCFEFQGADGKERNVREVLEPLILAIIHRVTEPLYDESKISILKTFFFGELWTFLRNPSIEEFVADLLRTGRKNNGIVLMETQSPLELAQSSIAPVILGQCPSRLYMRIKIDPQYVGMLELTPRKLELIANLRAPGQFLFDQPESKRSKILNLVVDERIRWLASNDPVSNAKRMRAIERHGPEVGDWLPALVGANGGSQ